MTQGNGIGAALADIMRNPSTLERLADAARRLGGLPDVEPCDVEGMTAEDMRKLAGELQGAIVTLGVSSARLLYFAERGAK